MELAGKGPDDFGRLLNFRLEDVQMGHGADLPRADRQHEHTLFFQLSDEFVSGSQHRVHAKDDEAKAFYLHYGFEPSPTDEYHLFLMMKDIRKSIGV